MTEHDSSVQEVIDHEYDAGTPASVAVIRAICAIEDVDPVEAPSELGFVLHDHVDPNALDTLLAPGAGTGRTVVSFALATDVTYHVDISDDGRIRVRSRSPPDS